MPRGKSKIKKKDQDLRGWPNIEPAFGSGTKRGGSDSGHPTDDEYDTADTLSVVSSTSDRDSVIAEGEDEVDVTSTQDNLEDKLKDCIEGLTQKSAKGRTDCLKSLKTVMCKKYLCDFLIERKITVLDCLERSLKKGKGEEQALAAVCSSLLLVQLGSFEGTDELYKSLQPILQVIMLDGSASLKARSACAEALGLATFLVGGDILQAMEIMKVLENVFRASYYKGDGSKPSHSPEVASLHTSAMTAWSLLLTIAPQSFVMNSIERHLKKMPQLLTSVDTDLRIATGEAIAMLYELAREEDEMFEGTDMQSLCETLKQLATDGNKYRAKKDRRQQRSSFRDILHTVEEEESPYVQVRFGQESIIIDSWARKRHYDTLCHLLSPGVNVHLQENELVRDIFGLGSPVPTGAANTTKISKFERQMYNAAAFKARTKCRSKHRDKRTANVHADS